MLLQIFQVSELEVSWISVLFDGIDIKMKV